MIIQKLTDRLHHYSLLTRLDKPIGSFLLLWPTLVAVWIASDGKPNALILFVFVCGVFLMRAAGCVLNDLADRNFDGYVARTKNRPLVTKAVSLKEALILSTLLLLVAFCLVLFMNRLTIFLAIIGGLFAAIYPFMKRVTYFPQVILGAAFNWGIPMAFAAQMARVPTIAWFLYLTALLWTVAYDTLYGMVDREDDLKIGIKSTAILFGKADRFIIAGLQILILILLMILGNLLKMNYWYYSSLIILTGFFVYQQWLIREREPKGCFKAFLNNNWAWFTVFFGVFLSYRL